MRKTVQQFFLRAILCVTAANAFAGSDVEDIDIRAYDPTASDRSLLVTFADRGINRVGVGPRGSKYTARGDYNSTTWARHNAVDIAEDYDLEVIAQWPVTELGVHCVVYYVPDGKSIEELEKALTKDKRVELVQRMGLFKVLGAANRDPYYTLQYSGQAIELEQLHKRSTGDGVRIAIIDTGIDVQHPDLDGQFIDVRNFVFEISKSFETDLHGTAVAGIIGAKGDNGVGIVGIAKDAKMYAYKACWHTALNSMDAACNSFTLALAINSAIRKGAQIINLSLTGPSDSLLRALLQHAIDRGIIVVAADDGVAVEDFGFPASMPQVIAVRNTMTASADLVSKLNIVTMGGTEILTTMPDGTYDFISGSSFAAASVSGLAALALQLQPNLTSTEIRSTLQYTGSDYSAILTNWVDRN